MSTSTQISSPLTPSSAPSRLRIDDIPRTQLEAWAAQAYPREACGLMLGHSSHADTHVVHVRRTRNLNVERPRDRFHIDPLEHLAIEDEARSLGLEVVGVWHSHPDQPARPSETDRISAWAGWSYVIVGVDARAAGSVRSWRLVDDQFIEEELSA